MFALHRKCVTLDRELKAAEAQFAADPTEENLGVLNQIREELSSHAGTEAQIEGFGAASGRRREPGFLMRQMGMVKNGLSGRR